MDESGMTQNRRSRRSNVLMAATIEVSGRALPVTLRNLSAEGALIEGDHLPVEGSCVLFRKKDLAVPGDIAWVSGRRAGVAFDRKLEPETVLRHIPPPRYRVQPSHKRPGLASRDLSPEERRYAEAWIWDKPFPALGD